MPRARTRVRAAAVRSKVRANVRIKARPLRRTLRELIDGLKEIETIARDFRLDLEALQTNIKAGSPAGINVGGVRPVVDGSCPPPK